MDKNDANPLLSDWELPPFDRIGTADYEPAAEAALAEAEARVRAIAESDAEPTFANTIEPLECADRRLNRVTALLLNLNECCSTAALQEVADRVEPRLTQFATRVSTDPKLFARVRHVHDHADPSALSPEQRTLLEDTYLGFTRHGALLEGAALAEYRANEEELTSLRLRFSRNVLADQNAYVMHLGREADLDGLPPSAVEAARVEAARRGLDGWAFTLAAPSYVPFLTYSRRRDLRRELRLAYGRVGGNGTETDNNAVIRRIVALRARQARLLGHDTYADYVLERRMVESLPNLRRFMQRLQAPVLEAARRDLEAMEGVRDFDGPVEQWDVSYLAERLRQQRHNFDAEQLRPYLPLPAVLQGVFGLYGRLYGLRFEEAEGVPVYHDEVRVYRVTDSLRGDAHMGLLYLDLHPREGKQSGAWMTEFRGQAGDMRPQIQVVCNFSRPVADRPALLSFDELHTLMHEMGHAMHGMLSQVTYESLSGTNVMRDFVELPSQLMENWCYEPDFLATFARHYESGEPLPGSYVEKIRAARNHLAAWYFLRQLNLGLTDLAFHTMTDAEGSWRAEEVEAAAMTELTPRTPGCCTATSFGHIFSGGYAAGYYGYKWAEALDADAFGRFSREGIFNPQTADDLRRHILSRGGTEHPALLFRRFMHRDPDPDALLRRDGLI